MASFSFTVPDAAVPRILLAFGTTLPDGTRSPATAAAVRDMLKNHVKSQVAQYEGGLLAASTVDAVSQEAW